MGTPEKPGLEHGIGTIASEGPFALESALLLLLEARKVEDHPVSCLGGLRHHTLPMPCLAG